MGAFLTGWIYLALVEFAIGMEVFRLLVIYLFVSHKSVDVKPVRNVLETLRTAAIYFLIPVSFVVWYQFFFENWRKAQDAGVQLGQLMSSPLAGLWAGIRLLQGTLNVSILAWTIPFDQNYFSGSLTDLLISLIIAFMVIAIVLVYLVFVNSDDSGSFPCSFNQSPNDCPKGIFSPYVA